MCSWCYAFRPVWTQIQQQLDTRVSVQYILGGLAPDSDQPMPLETRAYVQNQWRKIIETVPDTLFNFTFWEQCQPMRSTYPACRAVLLAQQRGREYEVAMIHAIQDVYYQQARNPSDRNTLYTLAQEIGLDADIFIRTLDDDATQQALLADIHVARRIGGNSFPSLFLQQNDVIQPIAHHYTDANKVLHAIKGALIR
ncbi:MAG: DsbA family protein [Methylococcales bacterium]|nr:DsbA family protein [Methylococcales bacterium]